MYMSLGMSVHLPSVPNVFEYSNERVAKNKGPEIRCTIYD